MDCTRNRFALVRCLPMESNLRETAITSRFIAAASFDSNITVYRCEEGEWSLFTELEGHVNEVKNVCWSRDSQLLASSSRYIVVQWLLKLTCRDRNIIVWGYNPEDDEMDCVSVLSGHSQDVKFVRFNPANNNLYSCSYDDTVKVWLYDGEDFSNINTLRAHEGTVWGLAFKKIAHPTAGEDAMELEEDCPRPSQPAYFGGGGIGLEEEDVLGGIDVPDDTRKEAEFVTCGMDGKVIYWKEIQGRWRIAKMSM